MPKNNELNAHEAASLAALESQLPESSELREYYEGDTTSEDASENEDTFSVRSSEADGEPDSELDDTFSVDDDASAHKSNQQLGNLLIVGDDKSKDFVIQPHFEYRNDTGRVTLKRHDARSGSDCINTLRTELKKQALPPPKKVIISSKKLPFILSAAEEACRQGIDFEFYRTAMLASRIQPNSTEGIYLSQLRLIAKSQVNGKKSLWEAIEEQLMSLENTSDERMKSICIKAIIKVASHDQNTLQNVLKFNPETLGTMIDAIATETQDIEQPQNTDKWHASDPRYIEHQVTSALQNALDQAHEAIESTAHANDADTSEENDLRAETVNNANSRQLTFAQDVANQLNDRDATETTAGNENADTCSTLSFDADTSIDGEEVTHEESHTRHTTPISEENLRAHNNSEANRVPNNIESTVNSQLQPNPNTNKDNKPEQDTLDLNPHSARF